MPGNENRIIQVVTTLMYYTRHEGDEYSRHATVVVETSKHYLRLKTTLQGKNGRVTRSVVCVIMIMMLG